MPDLSAKTKLFDLIENARFISQNKTVFDSMDNARFISQNKITTIIICICRSAFIDLHWVKHPMTTIKHIQEFIALPVKRFR